jgi:hypothetical protein
MVGSLVGWFPLDCLPNSREEPFARATLDALEAAHFHDGALFVNTGHSGWGTYLNMRVAGCGIRLGMEGGWRMMRWLLDHASPTYNWPEAIHPHSKGGSAGDGHHGWASAEWLLLVRAMLFDDSRAGLLELTPCLPPEWVETAGRLAVERAPTVFGALSYAVEWDAGGGNIRLELSPGWHTPPRLTHWYLPGRHGGAAHRGERARVLVDGKEGVLAGDHVRMRGAASVVEVTREL